MKNPWPEWWRFVLAGLIIGSLIGLLVETIRHPGPDLPTSPAFKRLGE